MNYPTNLDVINAIIPQLKQNGFVCKESDLNELKTIVKNNETLLERIILDLNKLREKGLKPYEISVPYLFYKSLKEKIIDGVDVKTDIQAPTDDFYIYLQ